MEVLSTNNKLRQINLSNIVLFDSNQETVVKQPERLDLTKASDEDMVATNRNITYEEDYLTDEAEASLKLFCRFLKRNTSLIHVNLNYCGLTVL